MPKMVWIPTIDGGMMELPDTDPRVKEYQQKVNRSQSQVQAAYAATQTKNVPAGVAKPGTQTKSGSEQGGAGSPTLPSSSTTQCFNVTPRRPGDPISQFVKPGTQRVVDYPGISEQQLRLSEARASMRKQEERAALSIVRKVMRQSDTETIMRLVGREFATRYARQHTALDSDVYSAPHDAAHDRAVLEVITIALKWASWDEAYNSDAQLRDGLETIISFREKGEQKYADLDDRARQSVSALRLTGGIFAQSLILRDAERYLWGRGGYEKASANTSLINSWDWSMANMVYEAYKAPSKIFGTEWAAVGSQPLSPLGGDFWFQQGITDHYYLDHDLGGRPLVPLPPSYERIWTSRQLQ